MKKTFLLTLLITVVVLGAWEYTSRSRGYIAAINDDKALWASTRARLERLGEDDLVVLGSSRAHFDIQLDEWEQETGIRPLMLACDGSTPTPVFRDIVEKSDFKGTVLIGVTPGLFFSKPDEAAMMWKRPQTRIDHYYDRTYAQRLNHILSLPPQRTFAFLNASEEEWADDIDLRSILNRIEMPRRYGEPSPPFYNFMYVDGDRNVTMLEKTTRDTAFANSIKRVWMYFGKNAPPPVKDEVLAIYEDLVKKFVDRGGKVIFVRFPSSGGFRDAERKVLPRDEFWEVLLQKTGMPGYHFEDYEVLNQYDPPEWSHLATPDAKIFTRDLVSILLSDNAIARHK